MKIKSISSPSTSTSITTSTSTSSTTSVIIFCTLLAIQFGLQPILTQTFILRNPQQISKVSFVLMTEIVKIIISVFYFLFNSAEWTTVSQQWSLSESLVYSFIPAVLYSIQNFLVQTGYSYLDSMTFNLLNQTKVNKSFVSHFHLRYLLTSLSLLDSLCSFLPLAHYRT